MWFTVLQFCLDAREWTNLLSLLRFIRLDLLWCAVCCTILTLKFTINETWSSWLCSVMSWLVSQAAAEMGVNGNRRFSTEGREFSFHRAALMRSVLRAETIFFLMKTGSSSYSLFFPWFLHCSRQNIFVIFLLQICPCLSFFVQRCLTGNVVCCLFIFVSLKGSAHVSISEIFPRFTMHGNCITILFYFIDTIKG